MPSPDNSASFSLGGGSVSMRTSPEGDWISIGYTVSRSPGAQDEYRGIEYSHAATDEYQAIDESQIDAILSSLNSGNALVAMNGSTRLNFPVMLESVAAASEMFELCRVSDNPALMSEYHSFWLERYSRGDIPDLRMIRGMEECDIHYIQSHWIDGRFPTLRYGRHVTFFGFNRHFDFLIECIRNVPRMQIGIVPMNWSRAKAFRQRIADEFMPFSYSTFGAMRVPGDTRIFMIHREQDFQGASLDFVIVEEPRE